MIRGENSIVSWIVRALIILALVACLALAIILWLNMPRSGDLATQRLCSNANVATSVAQANALTHAIRSQSFDFTDWLSAFSDTATLTVQGYFGYTIGTWVGLDPFNDNSIFGFLFMFSFDQFPADVQIIGEPTFDCGFDTVTYIIDIPVQYYCPDDFPDSLSDQTYHVRHHIKNHFDSNGKIDEQTANCDHSSEFFYLLEFCDITVPYTPTALLASSIASVIKSNPSIHNFTAAYVRGKYAPRRTT